MPPTVYTIGHSNHAPAAFLSLLQSQEIARLVDVRSQPWSRWAPHFRKGAMSRWLEQAGVGYAFMGEALGGRPEQAVYYDARDRVDYLRRARAADFIAGIEQLVVLASAAPTAIMCAEEDPLRCHRRALITPALRARGLEVVHLRGDGRAQPEADDRSPDGQLGLFG